MSRSGRSFDSGDLFCEACDALCYPVSGWIEHLLSAGHQTKVSQQAYHWEKPEKECALVVETTAKARITWHAILNRLAKLDADYVARNFVANPKNPVNLGVARFESREVVDKLFAEDGKGDMLIIDGHVVLIKRAVELSPTEWKAMVPEPSEHSSDDVSNTNQQLLWMEKLLGEPLHGGQKRSCDDLVSKSLEETPERKMKKSDHTKEDKPTSQNPTESAILASADQWEVKMKELQNLVFKTDYGLSSRSPMPLKTQLKGIFEAIEIPNNDTRALFFVIPTITMMFEANFPKLNVTAIPFRHKKLQLGNHQAKSDWGVFLCLENRRTLSFDWRVLHNSSFKRPLSLSFTEQDFVLEHVDSGVKFEFATNPQLQPEVSSAELKRHLGTFDDRAKPLLDLLHFWAAKNGVTLAEDGISRNLICHHSMSDSSALEWLIMFYLCHEKIIPTPRQVREFTPNPIFIPLEGLKVDVGFCEDSKFVLEWQSKHDSSFYNEDSEELALSVLKLVQGFFQFYSGNNFEGCVLNTMDAEVIAAAHVKNGLKGPCTKLDLIEWSRLRKLKLGERKVPGIYLMQPFFPCYSFSVCRTKFENFVRPLMRRTGEKLQVFLENLQQLENGNETCLTSDISLESVFACT